MTDEQNNSVRGYLVLVERISRMERDIAKLEKELERANESLSKARSDLRSARNEVENLRRAFEASTALLKQTQEELEDARLIIAAVKTELRIMAGIIMVFLVSVVGLVGKLIADHSLP